MTEDELKEREQMRKFDTFRKFATAIVLRRMGLLAGVFVLSALLVAVTVRNRVLRAPDRFEATTTLLFNPKQVSRESRLRVMDVQEVVQLMSRFDMKEKLAAKLHLDDVERARLGIDLAIVQDRNKRQVVSVTVKGPSEEAAVLKANAFADLCRQEYAFHRAADLEPVRARLVRRKKEKEDEMRKVASECLALRGRYDHLTSIDERGRLENALNERRGDLSRHNAECESWKLKCDDLASALRDVPEALLANVPEIMRRLQEIAVCESEIATLKNRWTDSSPLVVVKSDRLRQLQDALGAFLKELGAAEFPLARVGRLESLRESWLEAQVKMRHAQERVKGFRLEIERLEARLGEIRTKIGEYEKMRPEIEALEDQRSNLRSSCDAIRDDLDEIDDLVVAAANDLLQIERVKHARGRLPWEKKNLIVILFVACAVSGLALMLVVLLGLAFGTIAQAREIAYHSEALLIGALPADDRFDSEEQERSVMDRVFYRFCGACASSRLTFVGSLPGSSWSAKLGSAFAWNFAMCGVKTLTVRIVRAMDFKEPPGSVMLGGIVRNGQSAWFPVADETILSPGEIQLLESDLKTLASDCDALFLLREQPLRSTEPAVAQLIGLCSSVVLSVGVKSTRRADLRRVLELDRPNPDRPVAVIATGLKPSEIEKENLF